MIIPNSMISHIGKIWDGEYDIPLDIPNATVLDIGANVGGFAVWLSDNTDYLIHCFEPVSYNYQLLEQNCIPYDNITISNVAVAEKYGDAKMYLGKNNSGEASLYKGEEQSDIEVDVKTIDAKDLPIAEIVKIDTEGAEVMILKRIDFKPLIYVIEYHSEENRHEIHDYLKKNYNLVRANSYRPNYGVVSYIHKRGYEL